MERTADWLYVKFWFFYNDRKRGAEYSSQIFVLRDFYVHRIMNLLERNLRKTGILLYSSYSRAYIDMASKDEIYSLPKRHHKFSLVLQKHGKDAFIRAGDITSVAYVSASNIIRLALCFTYRE